MTQQGQLHVPSINLLEALDSRRNEVWRAQTADNSATVAVKLLKPAYEPLLPRRFRRAHRTLRRLVDQERGWAPLLDSGVAGDGRQYLVHPYYGAGSLADQLSHGPTPWYPATTIVARTAQILGRAHRVGWSFGYLRPSHVLLTGPLEPVLAVYGMSTRRFDDGSSEFMAPEVVTLGSSVPASDVYSLTLVLASLIAGRPVDHNEPVPELLAEIRGLAPSRIVDIIDHGLSPTLRNRSADATKMARALVAAIEAPDGTALDSVDANEEIDADEALAELLSEPLVVDGSSPHPDNGSQSPRPGVPDVDTDIPGTTTGPDVAHGHIDQPTVVPWAAIDDDTDPIGEKLRLPTHRSGTGAATSGPLSDLLNGADSSADPTVDFSSRDSTGHVDSARRTRQELTELIDGLGPATGSRQPGSDSGTGVDQEEADDEAGDDGPTDDDPGDGADGDGQHRNDVTASIAATGPSSGHVDDFDGDRGDLDADDDGVPFAPRLSLDSSNSTESHPTSSKSTRSPLMVFADHVAHIFALHRQRVASAAAILSIVGVTAAALSLGIGAVQANNVAASEGAPSPTLSTAPVAERYVSQQAPAEDFLQDAVPLAPGGQTATARSETKRSAGTTTLDQRPAPASSTTTTAPTSSEPVETTTVTEPEPTTTTSVGPTTTVDDDDGDDTTSTRRRRWWRRRTTTTAFQPSTTHKPPETSPPPTNAGADGTVATAPATTSGDDDDGDD